MPRAQLFIEGYAPDELYALARESSLLPLFAGKPVCVTYGSQTLLGGVKKQRGRLVIEVAMMQGAERALKALRAVVRQLARIRDIGKVVWRLPAATGSRGRASAPRSRSGRRRPSRPSR